jgi:cysteine-rich repeat protein
LLVPTAKSLVAPPPPPLASTVLDHFKCYRVRGARVRVPSVDVQTQFNPPPAPPIKVSIKRPRDLCLPVDKRGEGINDPSHGLICYQVRTLPQNALPHVFTTDQFGSADYNLFGIRDLCVPLIEGPGVCGDGRINSPGEECEVGDDAACPGDCNAQTCECGATPPAPVCGNQVVEAGEQCESDLDCAPCLTTAPGSRDCLARAALPFGLVCEGCQCAQAPFCGDGNTDPGEACDDGNAINGDGCDDNCTVSACGNGVQAGTETCDDGNLTDGDGCDSNCTVTGCGNGVQTGTEACDDGNQTNGDGCDSNCTVTGCGNGVVTGTEVCDDGNATNGDGCDNNCTVTGCGNGIVTLPEGCDDGNQIDDDGCNNLCQAGIPCSQPGEPCELDEDCCNLGDVCCFDRGVLGGTCCGVN